MIFPLLLILNLVAANNLALNDPKRKLDGTCSFFRTTSVATYYALLDASPNQAIVQDPLWSNGNCQWASGFHYYTEELCTPSISPKCHTLVPSTVWVETALTSVEIKIRTDPSGVPGSYYFRLAYSNSPGGILMFQKPYRVTVVDCTRPTSNDALILNNTQTYTFVRGIPSRQIIDNEFPVGKFFDLCLQSNYYFTFYGYQLVVKYWNGWIQVSDGSQIEWTWDQYVTIRDVEYPFPPGYCNCQHPYAFLKPLVTLYTIDYNQKPLSVFNRTVYIQPSCYPDESNFAKLKQNEMDYRLNSPAKTLLLPKITQRSARPTEQFTPTLKRIRSLFLTIGQMALL
ncbi:hypothetical protein FGO68_gene6890 [Halteria grandinella]|uniref:Uncharacterized protein n=1 Tax=Halteria grandinella TaxID=5974 RepID=A0A8J8P5L2_HALGN|nr:hypothetical protein FGO68_gene6890 [Halteria grandinella]